MKMEDIVFNLYKDNIITCKAFREEVSRLYKIENTQDLFVRIVNYQIEKYGHQLRYAPIVDNSEDCKRKCKRAKARKQAKRRYYAKTNRRSKVL